MSEQDFNAVFSKRLRYYLSKKNMTQAELAKQIGVGTTSVYNWCNGIKTPRMDKVDAMCELFDCKRSDLISEQTNPSVFKLALSNGSEFSAKSPQELRRIQRLLSYYVRLNEIGQRKAMDNLEDLSKIYSVPEAPRPQLNAAHSRTDISDAERTQEAKKTEEDIMDDPNF